MINFQLQAMRQKALENRIALITFILQYVNTVPFISAESKTEFKERMRESYNADEALVSTEREMYEERISKLEAQAKRFEEILESLDLNNI